MTFTAHFYHKRKALGWTISTKAKSHGEAVAKLAPLIMQFDGWEMRHIKVKEDTERQRDDYKISN